MMVFGSYVCVWIVLSFCSWFLFSFVFIFFCNTLRVMGFSPSGWCFASEGRGVGNVSWPLRG
jgi:uncharacterized membrane protein